MFVCRREGYRQQNQYYAPHAIFDDWWKHWLGVYQKTIWASKLSTVFWVCCMLGLAVATCCVLGLAVATCMLCALQAVATWCCNCVSKFPCSISTLPFVELNLTFSMIYSIILCYINFLYDQFYQFLICLLSAWCILRNYATIATGK